MKHRFEVLDIFRGLFAAFVFLFHLAPFADNSFISNNFTKNADMFVDFFFVLSGFVMAYRYQNIATGEELKLFLIKRIYRIYPLHLLMLFLFAVVELGKKVLNPYIKVNNLDNPANNVISFFSSLFLLNSTPIPGVNDVSWNIVSWSISAELIAYVVFGTAVLYIYKSRLYTQRNLVYLLLILISLTGLYLISFTFKINYSFDYGFLRGILGFFSGVICFNLFARSNSSISKYSSHFFSTAELSTLVLISLLIYNGEVMKPWGAIFDVLFFICIYTFSFEKGFISAALKKVFLLHKLGMYSYSIYMTHALLISLFNILFIRILKFPTSSYSYFFILNFAIIYFVSAWTYQHVEMRFQYKAQKRVKPSTVV
ncbi:acyltransferase [Dyadobacter sp. CY312]|uniref:acyltransferase family protein n=1 Tax=Dyadobacter sp. CY312 TaxID=2907303 RepID=UPI001F42E206|nr:acyltransferase [Dyadobacter sp. CY312]MCE7041474.1 acyltransferase [Dyadobacter sp. CY312]